jgi:anti-sigma factor RsiW
MNCVSPPELNDRQLLAAIDEEADTETADHLIRCPYCRKRAKALEAQQRNLTARLYRLSCPSPLELGDFHLGMLPRLKAAAVASHLQECPHCAFEIAQLSSYLGETAPSSKSSPFEGVKNLVARLISPGEGSSFAGGPLAAAHAPLRGGAKGPITLEADGILILLDVQPYAEGQAAVVGTVAAHEQDSWTGAQVELYQADRPPITANVDDLGAFRCEGILPGAAELRITPQSGPSVTAAFEVVV